MSPDPAAEQRELALRRINRVSADWAAQGVAAPSFETGSPGEDGLLAHGARRGPAIVTVPMSLWDDLPDPRRIVLTDPDRTPPLIAGLLTWYGNHHHPPIASHYLPPVAAKDSHVQAATITITGAIAARTLAKGPAYRRAWVATLVPHLLRTLNGVLRAPPALSVALLTALTQSRIVTNGDWEQWAYARLGEAEVLQARELGSEAAAIGAHDSFWVRDLIVETARRSRPRPDDMSKTEERRNPQRATEPPQAASESALNSGNSTSLAKSSAADGDVPPAQQQKPGEGPPDSTESPSEDAATSNDGMSNGREGGEEVLSNAGQEKQSESTLTSTNDRSQKVSADRIGEHEAGSSDPGVANEPASGQADAPSAVNSTDGMSSPAPSSGPSSQHSSASAARSPSAQANPLGDYAPGGLTEDNCRQSEGSPASEDANGRSLNRADDRSTPVQASPEQQVKAACSSEDVHRVPQESSTSADDRSMCRDADATEPVTTSENDTSLTTNDDAGDDVPSGILAAAENAANARRNHVRIPKPKPSSTQLATIAARHTREKDRDKGREHLDKVFPPGRTAHPTQDGEKTHHSTTPGKGRRRPAKTTITWRTPSQEERRASRKIATALRKAKVRAPAFTDEWTTEPPGRVDMERVMQEEAFHAMGMDVEVPVFQTTRIDLAPEPELVVGFCVDISGSMKWATTAAPSIAWCILKAVNDIGGRTCAVRFGDGVHPLFAPGRVPPFIPEFQVSGGGGHSYTEALHVLDEALHLQSTPNDEAAKIVFVFSDGIFGPAQESTGTALAERLHRRAGVKFVWVAVPPAFPRAPGALLQIGGTSTNHDLARGLAPEDLFADLPKDLATAVVSALSNHKTKRPRPPVR